MFVRYRRHVNDKCMTYLYLAEFLPLLLPDLTKSYIRIIEEAMSIEDSSNSLFLMFQTLTVSRASLSSSRPQRAYIGHQNGFRCLLRPQYVSRAVMQLAYIYIHCNVTITNISPCLVIYTNSGFHLTRKLKQASISFSRETRLRVDLM